MQNLHNIKSLNGKPFDLELMQDKDFFTIKKVDIQNDDFGVCLHFLIRTNIGNARGSMWLSNDFIADKNVDVNKHIKEHITGQCIELLTTKTKVFDEEKL